MGQLSFIPTVHMASTMISYRCDKGWTWTSRGDWHAWRFVTSQLNTLTHANHHALPSFFLGLKKGVSLRCSDHRVYPVVKVEEIGMVNHLKCHLVPVGHNEGSGKHWGPDAVLKMGVVLTKRHVIWPRAWEDGYMRPDGTKVGECIVDPLNVILSQWVKTGVPWVQVREHNVPWVQLHAGKFLLEAIAHAYERMWQNILLWEEGL